MSLKKSSFLAALVFVGAIVAAYVIQIQFNGDPLKREPTSAESRHLKTIKMQKLSPLDHNHPAHTEKLRGPVTVSIEPLEDSSKQQGETYTLRLIVESSENLDFLDYKWSVPAGVEMTSGSMSGQFRNLEIGQVQYVDATFQSLTGKNEQIHALVSKEMDGSRFAEVAQFNTVFEPFLKRDKSKTLESNDSLDKDVEQQFKVFE